MQLSQLAQQMPAYHRGRDARFSAVCSDTRSLQPGELFVALSGPNFDGHDYLAQAAERGAAAALVSRGASIELPQLQVDDTRLGLGRLAALWRARSQARVIALTGSNGKTTVKEMIAAMLAEQAPVLATEGNLNNDIGMPLTLLRLQDEPFAVLEMGASAPGEIDYLSRIAEPDVALLNNAGRAHLQGFGSLEGVARAKAEIINGLKPDGLFVFNADSAWSHLWAELAGDRRYLGFGLSRAAEVRSEPGAYQLVWNQAGFDCRFVVQAGDESFEVSLALAGQHNRMNALAAIAVAREMGLTAGQMRAGLARLKAVPGRLCPCLGSAGQRVIDDSYNANPESVAAAIRVLAGAPGRRTLVLGDLAELGSDAMAMHAELGQQARKAGINRLFTLGELSARAAEAFGAGGRSFDELPALLDALTDGDGDDTLLIKGSRSARMERVVRALCGEGAAC